MSKATEQNDKLKRAIIISVVLHIILIAVLIWSSFDQHIDASAGGGSVAIDAVMVDPGALVQNHNRQQQQQDSARRAQQQREKQARQQEEELREKQAAEQQRLKKLEKERLAAQEAAKNAREQQKQAEEVAAAAKAQEEAAKQAAAEVRKKAEQEIARAADEAKKKAAAEAAAIVAKAREEAAQKAAAEKAAAEKKAAEKAAAEKKAAEKATAAGVDDLFGALSAGKNAPKEAHSAGAGGTTAAKGNKPGQGGASREDIASYIAQVQLAIRGNLYDWDSYKGKECTLRVNLAADGALLSVKQEGGDPVFCQQMLAATNRMSKFPKPPSQAVYETFKNAPLDFRP